MNYKLLIIFLTTLIVNCQEENDRINNVLVNFQINTTLPAYNSILTVGNAIQINNSDNINGYCCGVRGVIIYHYSINEYIAYERNCTFQPNNACAQIHLDNSMIFATDSCCNSKFLLLDGSVIEGPAINPLKTYNTSFDGTFINVFN